MKACENLREKKSAFDLAESHLCAELGMSRNELRARRKYFLVEGTHFDYVAKRVLYAHVGREILLATRHQPLPEKNGAGADSEPARAPIALLLEKNPPPVAFTGQLVVWATPKMNTRLLVCYLPGTDPNNPMNLVSCHVRSNENFMRGMVFPPTAGRGSDRRVMVVSETVYELLGLCPRFRGRW